MNILWNNCVRLLFCLKKWRWWHGGIGRGHVVPPPPSPLSPGSVSTPHNEDLKDTPPPSSPPLFHKGVLTATCIAAPLHSPPHR